MLAIIALAAASSIALASSQLHDPAVKEAHPITCEVQSSAKAGWWNGPRLDHADGVLIDVCSNVLLYSYKYNIGDYELYHTSWTKRDDLSEEEIDATYQDILQAVTQEDQLISIEIHSEEQLPNLFDFKEKYREQVSVSEYYNKRDEKFKTVIETRELGFRPNSYPPSYLPVWWYHAQALRS